MVAGWKILLTLSNPDSMARIAVRTRCEYGSHPLIVSFPEESSYCDGMSGLRVNTSVMLEGFEGDGLSPGLQPLVETTLGNYSRALRTPNHPPRKPERVRKVRL